MNARENRNSLISKGEFSRDYSGLAVKLRVHIHRGEREVRETSTGDALVRKGLAKEVSRAAGGRWYIATDAEVTQSIGDGAQLMGLDSQEEA